MVDLGAQGGKLMSTCKATIILGEKDICKDCMKADVCKHKANLDKDSIIGMSVEECEYFKDRSKFIEMPCKVGDTVYLVLKGVTDVLIGDVRRMSFNHKNELVISIGRQKGRYYTTGNHKISSFGKSVFLTKEEAEQALKNQN